MLAGQPKLRNELGKPILEEIGHRSATFPLYGIRDSKREYIEWLLKVCTKAGVKAKDVIEEEAIDLLAERLTTPLEIESNLTRALESAHLIGEKPVSTRVIDSVMPAPVSDLEATLMRNGYDPKGYFCPNRRIGIFQGYIVAVELRYRYTLAFERP